MSANDDYVSQLAAQATEAVKAGADPAAVEKHMQELIAKSGLAPEAPVQPKVDKATKAAYRDAVVPEVMQDVQASNRVPNSPQQGIFQNVEGDSTTSAPQSTLDALSYGVKGSVKRGLSGLATAGAAATGLLNPVQNALNPGMQDEIFAQAQALKDSGTADLKNASGNAGIAGQFVGGALGGFVGEPIAAATDALDQGKSLSDAEKINARGGAVNVASVGLGLLGSQAKGLAPFLSRAALQVPGSVGITAADKALAGEDITKGDLALAAGGGLLSAAFRNPKTEKPSVKAEEPIDIPITGDVDFDAGTAFAKSITEAKPVDITKIDVSNQAPFSQGLPPGWKYKDVTQPKTTTNFETTPADAVTSLNQERQAIADIQRVKTNANFAESDKLDNAQQMSRAMLDEEAPAITQPDAPANNPLDTPELAQLKTQLQAEQAPKTAELPAQPEGVDVTTNPVDPTLDRATTTKLTNQRLTVDEAGNTVPVDIVPKRSKSTPIKTEDDLTAALKTAEGRRNIFEPNDEDVAGTTPRNSNEGEVYAPRSVENIPRNAGDGSGGTGNADLPFLASHAKVAQSVRKGLADGTLTGDHVLNAIINNDGDLYRGATVVQGFTKQLQNVGKKLGGLGVKFEHFDPSNPAHASVGERNPRMMNAEANKRPAATWDPVTNKIYLNHGVGMNTLVHEVGHSIVARAIAMGEKGKLSGTSATAHKTLQSLFDTLKPHLDAIASKEEARLNSVAGADPKKVSAFIQGTRGYGMKDLHEFMSELFSSAQFRNHLESLKLTPEMTAQLGHGASRTVLGKVRNAYEAVTRLVRNMLGLSPKADNALDAMFSAAHDFTNSISGDEASVLKGMNDRGHATAQPDMSFLGEQAPSRYSETGDVEQPSNLQKPRSRAVQFAKQFLGSKGIEPIVTNARHTREGLVAEGDAEAIQSANRLMKIATPANRADIGAALQGDTTAFKKLSQEAQSIVRSEYTNNFDRSLEIVKSIAADPNATAEQKAIGKTILEKAGTYQTRVYQMSDLKGKYMAGKMALAEKAKAKMAKGQELSPRELEAYQSVDTARKYLENTWLPDTDKLAARHTDELEQLYKFHTGLDPDAQFKGMERTERRQALVGAVAEKLRAVTNEGNVLDDVVKAAAGLGQKKASQAQYYSNLRRSSSIFSERQDVPEALRQFWGEISDPVARNISTVRAQYSYLANLKAQNQLRAEGLGKIFSETKGQAGYSETVTGEKMGPLQGLHVTPDVKLALDSVFEMNSAVGDLLEASVADNTGVGALLNVGKHGIKGIAYVAGKAKLATVLGNVGNYVNNAIGSHLQVASNGNINPVSWARGIKLAGESIGMSLKDNMSVDLRDALKYKLLEYSHIQELQGSRHATRIKEILEEAAASKSPLRTLQKTLRGLRNAGREGMDIYKEAYGVMDSWSKMANWFNEVDFWKAHNEKYGTGLSEDQIKTNVARRINDTNITPSMAPQMLKSLEKVGATRFGTYYSEVARTLANNMKYGALDAKAGFESGQMDLAVHGIKRLVGSAGSIIAQNKQFAAMAKITAGAIGLASTQLADDDPRKKYMDKDDFMKSIDPLLLSDPAHPESGEYVYDLSRADPYAPIMTPIKQFLGAVHEYGMGDKKKAQEEASKAVDGLKGLRSANTIWLAMYKAVKGSSPSISRTAPAAYDAAMKRLTDVGFSVANANSVLDSLAPFEPKSFTNYLQSKEEKSPALSAAIASGQGVLPFNVAKDLSNYVGVAAKADIATAKKGYLDLMKQNYESSPERLESSFKDGLKEAAKPYETLKLAVGAAKAQGASRSDLVKRMQAAGVSVDIMGTILNNKPFSVLVMNGDLNKDFETDLIDSIGDPDKKKAAIERYKTNTRQIGVFLRKYRNTNVEDL